MSSTFSSDTRYTFSLSRLQGESKVQRESSLYEGSMRKTVKIFSLLSYDF